MAIKSTVAPANEPANRWPRLMRSTAGTIVLMTKVSGGGRLGVGAVVGHAEVAAPWKVGAHNDDWSLSEFVDFDGTVTLTNEGR